MSIYCTRAWIGEYDASWPGAVIHSPGNDLSKVGPKWPHAIVHTDHIPAWCDWPPSGDDGDERTVAPWLRLGICDNDEVLDVLIDEKAALQLAGDLIEWANRPKTRRI